jgi:4-amino-4-deoxy-L-arabinose transferase-like glycosyltransferase
MLPDSILKKIRSRKWEFILLAIIIAAGIFFRVYHFSDWLHFEIDQVYDIDSISNAIQNGPQNLPLLGTNAGGGLLRLGPAFYYLEYVSAEIFGNTPPGHAAFVLIFSIFSLPLFYLFCKRYFETEISLGLLAVFSFSLYLILYSRFSWSPNVLPFLILFSFYALLKSIPEDEKRRNMWFLLAVSGITICTQIHFNVLLVVPGTVLIFLLLKRPRFSWKTWLWAVAVVIFLYSPLIANEIKTHGQNSKLFLKSVIANNRATRSFEFSSVEGIKYNALEYFLIISGNDQINELPRSCSQSSDIGCFKNKTLQTIGFAYFFLGIFSLLYLFSKKPDEKRRDFLLLSLSWFFVSFVLFVYLIFSGFTMRSRFALISAPMAIILLGFVFEPIFSQRKKVRLGLFLIVVLTLLWFNGTKIKEVFTNLKKAGIESFKVEQEDVFPNTNRITLEQQYAIIDYMRSKFSQNNFPVFFRSDRTEYYDTFWYHLGNLGVVNYGPIHARESCPEANYFLIITNFDLGSLALYFDVVEVKSFGTLNVFQLTPKKEKTACTKEDDLQRYSTAPETKGAEMMTWKKLFE